VIPLPPAKGAARHAAKPVDELARPAPLLVVAVARGTAEIVFQARPVHLRLVQPTAAGRTCGVP
jgi:hypothetical protein